MLSRKSSLFVVVSAMLGGLAGLLMPPPTRLTFVNVGQGDCAVFETGGAVMLIDAGPKSGTLDAGARIVVPRLKKMGVDGVDLILLSHPDMDHIGGTGAVVKAFPSARIAVSAYFRSNHQLLEQLRQWGRDPSSVLWLSSELVGRVGDFQVRVDCPAIGAAQETNDGSMFVRFWDESASVVFTGDAPAKDEMAIDALGDWRSEVMKAGHHGSRTATSQDWLDHVKPEYVILSCGRGNRYGHPHKEVVDRLSASHIEALRTDREGDISFTLRGGRFVRE